jgi:DNA-binding MarR family transcriptional regulator
MLPDPADHRCRRVELTEKAEQCQQEISQHIREMEKRMLTGMSEDEVETLVRLLDQATKNLTEAPAKEEIHP